MRPRIAAAAALLICSVASATPYLAAPPTAAAAPSGECTVKVGGALTGTPWAQRRLDFQRAWPVTTGAGVVVAVIDSGLNTAHKQLSGTHVTPGVNVIDPTPSTDVRDCAGHGTSVTAIIAAQHINGVAFLGVAPDVTVVPIKQTNTQGDKTGTAEGIARGIDAAIAAKARVANISVTVTTPSAALRAAVARAAKANLVIVAAAGNDGQNDNFAAYPAAYSKQFPNVIAVSASDEHDGIAQFADTGSYVTVAAPGAGVEAPQPIRGYRSLDGTSFAAPFVTGTVALVLAAHPELSAAQVRNRIEATADRPPATVPDPRYGYGIVNPYLAVTAIRDDSLAAPPPVQGPPLPAPAAAAPKDRHLIHVALTAGVVLLTLTVLAGIGAAVARGADSSNRGVAPD